MESIKFHDLVDVAVAAAMRSPCQSKRGVVIHGSHGRIISSGFNHQPFPFICDGSERCKRSCGRTAIHAEQAAIIAAGVSGRPLLGSSILHAKARDGKPCASMAPSCLECSKLILECAITWMHLLHDPQAQVLQGASVVGEVEGFQSDGRFGVLQVRRYNACDFHRLTAEGWHGINLVALGEKKALEE